MSPAPATAPSRRTSAPPKGRGLSSVRPPRRVSGPASGRRRVPAAPPATSLRLPRPLLALARGGARVLRHPLLDRVISGRWSIALIAFALIGIVTLQLGLLKLNVGVGRSLERAQTLERENATLGIENAELASPERVRQLAARLGMSPVALTQLRFLRAAHGHGTDEGAAARLRPPVHPAGETATNSSAAAGEASGSESSAGGESSSGEASSSEASSSEGSSAESPSSEAAGGEASEASSSEASAAGEAPSSETASAETSSEETTGG